MNDWFSGGQAVDSIALDDRTAQYGDGLFETVAIRNGKARFWHSHIARLQIGCERLGISPPPSEELSSELENALAQTTVALEFATAKLVLSAGLSPRGYRRRSDMRPIVRVGIFVANRIPGDHYRDGVAVRICSSRLAIQPQLAGIKSMNRLEQVLASSEWDDAGIFEGLMQDTAGRLICGTMSNMFIVAESKLLTPALTRCGVSGVMRRHLLELMQASGIDCDVRDIEYADLENASELFLSNSQFGVLPVRRYGERDMKVGPVSRNVQRLAADNAVPECAP